MRALQSSIKTRAMAASLVAVTSVGVGCGDNVAPSPQHAELEEGIVARVGDVSIRQATVSRIASAQRLTPREALQVAIGDALFEAEMRRRGVLNADSAAFDASLARRARAELSRAVLIQLGEKVAGPVTDEELKNLIEKYWMQVRRPKGWRVAHALIKSADPTPEEREVVEAHAKEILRAMAPIAEKAHSTPAPERYDSATIEDMRSAELRDAVAALPKVKSPASGAELETKVEELPPIAAEGWAVEPGRARFEPDFVKAAVALKERGDVSEIVWSPFGAHVILLLEIVPGNMLSDEALRKEFLLEAIALRARGEQAKLLETLRADTRVSHADGVDALLREVGGNP